MDIDLLLPGPGNTIEADGRCERKSGQGEAEYKDLGGSKVEGDNEISPDFGRNLGAPRQTLLVGVEAVGTKPSPRLSQAGSGLVSVPAERETLAIGGFLASVRASAIASPQCCRGRFVACVGRGGLTSGCSGFYHDANATT